MSAEACEAAAKNCRSEKRSDEEVSNSTRWEDLEVEVWEGGVEVWNERLEGVEAVVLTEVRLLAFNLRLQALLTVVKA